MTWFCMAWLYATIHAWITLLPRRELRRWRHSRLRRAHTLSLHAEIVTASILKRRRRLPARLFTRAFMLARIGRLLTRVRRLLARIRRLMARVRRRCTGRRGSARRRSTSSRHWNEFTCRGLHIRLLNRFIYWTWRRIPVLLKVWTPLHLHPLTRLKATIKRLCMNPKSPHPCPSGAKGTRPLRLVSGRK